MSLNGTGFSLAGGFRALLTDCTFQLLQLVEPGAYLGAEKASAWIDWVRGEIGGTRPLPPVPHSVLRTCAEQAQLFDPAHPWLWTHWLEEAYLAGSFACLPRAERRRSGQVFTPLPTAEHLVHRLAELVHPPLEGPLRIADPALGAGVFWTALLHQRLAGVPEVQRLACYADLMQEHLWGIEKDPLLADLARWRARAAWWGYKLRQAGELREEFQADPPEQLQLHITQADFLQDPLPDLPQFDALIANPPYAFGESMPEAERAALSAHYAVARGQFDRAWCFFEAGMARLKPGGILVYLVPDALAVRPEAGVLREWLGHHATIRAIEPIGAVFPGIQVGSVAVYLQKRAVPLALVPATAPDPWYVTGPRPSGALPPTADCLGDFVTITRGEECGVRECVALADHPTATPVLRGRDLSMLEAPVPVVGLLKPIRKALARYRGPKILLTKTGAAPIVALDPGDTVVLQSVYQLHLRPKSEFILTLPQLAWLLASPPLQNHFKSLTSGKAIFPQLNQHQILSVPLPSPARLNELRALWERGDAAALADWLTRAWD